MREEPKEKVQGKWNVIELDECESTFNVARKEQPWTIVSAERQHKGRGRFNRAWIGETGGLWATYNLPLDPRAGRHWGLLPLVAGVAIIKALKPYNIKLRQRVINIVCDICHCDREKAVELLDATDWEIRAAAELYKRQG